jgi:hypothetical protein
MSSEKIKVFCDVLKSFISDIYKSYPDNSLLLLQQSLYVMLLTDPKSVVVQFMDSVDPFYEKILQKDEDFFLNGELEKIMNNGEYSFLSDELNKISTIWRDPKTPEKTKNSIWKYFITLLKLGRSILT